ncbi:chemotaxis protein CheA [Uliginosibacterium sp. H3]|uniref:Chemotaxis protein CheA n=1 Tax=Uliginosibacterium silvisoli TaxID=3114758 RepID=A0ABU6K312_9RHOO|nr:chemotaxis protein CheA [Uliginosibacterium sp. H3]
MDLSAARDALVEESRELLANMEKALLEIETEGPTQERINAVFRAAHTIKGSAGLFGLDLIVSFTHVMESVLDRVRNQEVAIDDALLSVLLRCGDYIAKLVDAIETGSDREEPDPVTRAALLDKLETHLTPTPSALAPIAEHAVTPADAKLERDNDGAAVSNENWHISLRFGRDVLKNGMDPVSFIHYLSGIGEIVHLHTIASDLPPAAEMDAEECYLGFEIDFRSDADKAKIESVFEFVREDSRIRILPPRAKMSEYIAVIDAIAVTGQKLGEILVQGGTLTQSELNEILALQRTTSVGGNTARLGELLIEEHMVQAPVVAAALSKQKHEEKRSAESRVIKVEAAKLDQLINLVGELVIASAGARILADRSRQVVLSEALAEVGDLVGQIRDGALNMRMIPIGEVFQRFPRVVRDVSQELGKKIDLVITGADTELDKSMVEKLADPLMHIVRNAIDHGIEPIDVREAAGKSAQGKVRLHAYHESGCVVVEISDDGKGLDAQRIKAKAIEKGMIAADAVLSDSEAYKLIFAPGFSTAEQITNISGRGVGMDVVKRSIEALRGDIELESTRGQGTTLRIRLPLTLAIINGFQVGVSGSVFVVPLDMVEECVEFSAESGHDYTNLRGQILPFIRLRELFDVQGEAGPRENIVVVKYANRKFGLVVDELLGEAQTVIKPLSKIFNNVKGISGSSILGTGDVALILDVPTLMQQAQSSRAPDKLSQAQ